MASLLGVGPCEPLPHLYWNKDWLDLVQILCKQSPALWVHEWSSPVMFRAPFYFFHKSSWTLALSISHSWFPNVPWTLSRRGCEASPPYSGAFHSQPLLDKCFTKASLFSAICCGTTLPWGRLRAAVICGMKICMEKAVWCYDQLAKIMIVRPPEDPWQVLCLGGSVGDTHLHLNQWYQSLCWHSSNLSFLCLVLYCSYTRKQAHLCAIFAMPYESFIILK